MGLRLFPEMEAEGGQGVERLRRVKGNPTALFPGESCSASYSVSCHAELYTNSNRVGGGGCNAVG